MAKFKIAATMIIRPYLTIEADSAEEAVTKLKQERFDTDELIETAFPAGQIDAEDIYLNDKRVEADNQ